MNDKKAIIFKINGHWAREKSIMLEPVFLRFVRIHNLIFHRIEFFSQDGDNIIKDKITVRLIL